jgi:DNA polymerase III epsilon subunit-like protein
VPHRATYDAIVCARLLAHLATPPGRDPLTLTELLDIMAGKTATDNAADEPTATFF